MWSDFFQLSSIPANHIVGSYNVGLVILSYIVATGASYVALDITSRMREVGVSRLASYVWVIGGAIAMGAGIWSMHFIGMLAFIMPMPMSYAPFLTGLSMIIAIVAAWIAFTLLRSKTINSLFLVLGGILLGFSIAAMHYVGMAAMRGMDIHYIPSLFIISILIAIGASEAALYLALQSPKGSLKSRIRLKIGSALIMGAAICGMHYTGMAAAIFTPLSNHTHMTEGMDPNMLAIAIAIVTIFILGIAVALSSFQAILNARNAEMARGAGMAEVASNVLHNIGNVLNSINVSSSLIVEHLNNINFQHLSDLNHLLKENEHNLVEFISSDPKGSTLPKYLSLLTQHWQNEYGVLKKELNLLISNIEHIKNIISMQQTLSGKSTLEELVSIPEIIDESLIIINIDFSRHGIEVRKEYNKLEPIYVDKSKLTQILINLIRNAKESLLECKKKDKYLLLKTGLLTENKFFIEVTDNGLGISQANQIKIFSHGFTTKKSGHGFGLHSSAIAAGEMNGALSVVSQGLGKGVTFTLELPYKIAKKGKTSKEVK